MQRPILQVNPETKKASVASASPLEGMSSAYTNTAEDGMHGKIVDNTQGSELLLYPAGISKKFGDFDRQSLYKAMYEYLKDRDLKTACKVMLKAEPTNKYDCNAVMINLSVEKNSPLYAMDGKNMGYVPKVISAMIKKNLDMFEKPGYIVSVRADYYQRYFAAKVALPYHATATFNRILLGRFRDILEDD